LLCSLYADFLLPLVSESDRERERERVMERLISRKEYGKEGMNE
jgi:hypothetical protein